MSSRAMSLAARKPAKRQKIARNHRNNVGPSDLIDFASGGFENKSLKPMLLSSPNISAVDILVISLEYVFGWRGDVTYVGREKALDFVVEWLAKDWPGESSSKLPSLTCLCAQRIAMEKFHTFVPTIDANFVEENVQKFIDFFQNDLGMAALPEILRERIKEELCIFVIMHLFCIDVRSWTIENASMDLNLPINGERAMRCDGSFSGHCLRFSKKIRTTGRGSLAKAAVLPHSILTHFAWSFEKDDLVRKNVTAMAHALKSSFPKPKKDPYQAPCKDPYSHPSVFQHPFAYSSVATPVAAFINAFLLRDSLGRSNHHSISFSHVQDMKSWMDSYRKLNNYNELPTLDEYSYLLLTIHKKLPHDVKLIEERPLLLPANLDVVVSNCSRILDANTIRRSSAPDISYLRLDREFSKENLLKGAIAGRTAEILDLQNCCNLDEECLGAILEEMPLVKKVVLTGTPVSAESIVIRKTRLLHKRVIFDFGANAQDYIESFGSSELFFWASDGCSDNDLKTELLLSSILASPDVLKLLLEYVFGWKKWKKTHPKLQARNFVKQWLENYRQRNLPLHLPTLTRLSAQRIAWRNFQKVVKTSDACFTQRDSEKLISIVDCDMVSTPVPEDIHGIIKEELCTFVIDYLLSLDLQIRLNTNRYIPKKYTTQRTARLWWRWMSDEE